MSVDKILDFLMEITDDFNASIISCKLSWWGSTTKFELEILDTEKRNKLIVAIKDLIASDKISGKLMNIKKGDTFINIAFRIR